MTKPEINRPIPDASAAIIEAAQKVGAMADAILLRIETIWPLPPKTTAWHVTVDAALAEAMQKTVAKPAKKSRSKKDSIDDSLL